MSNEIFTKYTERQNKNSEMSAMNSFVWVK